MYSRVMLKVSGEMLGRRSRSMDVSRISNLCEQVGEVAGMGVEIAMVVGGGNIIRGTQVGREHGPLHRATADYMGMLSTLINALALQDALEHMGTDTRVMSAIEAKAVCEPYVRRRAMRHLEKKRVVILAGGSGHPYFSTDTTAALRAMELGAEILLKATKVDGVYSADPALDPAARLFKNLSYMEALRRRLRVMDSTAISLCMENELPILVFGMGTRGNIRRAVEGEKIGTLVCSKQQG